MSAKEPFAHACSLLDGLSATHHELDLKVRPRSGSTALSFPFFHGPILHAVIKQAVRLCLPPGATAEHEQTIRQAVVPVAREQGRIEFEPDQTYRLGLTLLKNAPTIDQLAAALTLLGATSDAKGGLLSGNFSVERVAKISGPTHDDIRNLLERFDTQGFIGVHLTSPFTGTAVDAAASARRLSARTFELSAWLTAIYWRVFSVVNGRKPDWNSSDDQTPPIDHGTLEAAQLFDVRMPKRRGGRAQDSYDIPSVIGSFAVRGLPQRWWPWLVAGQLTHAGQGVQWSLGRYDLNDGDATPRFSSGDSWLSQIGSEDALRRAMAVVERNLEAAESTELQALDLARLGTEIRERRYTAQPLYGFDTLVHGKVRALATATIEDRVVQRATLDTVGPALDTLFNECSFGYRQGRSRRQAADRLSAAWRQGYRFALDADITAFFDHVDWTKLFAKLDAFLADPGLVQLVRQWVAADVVYQGKRIARTQGLPLGIAVSPVLANFVLDDLDDQLEEAGFRVVRYADDFVVLTKDRATAERAKKEAELILRSLNLGLSEEKTRIADLDSGLTYLGYLFCRSMVIDTPGTEEPVAPVIKSTWASRLTQPPRELTAEGGLLSLEAAATVVERVPLGSDGGSGQTVWPLYVIGRGTSLHVRYGTLVVVPLKDTPIHVPVETVSHVMLFGSVAVSTDAVLRLGALGVPIFYCERSGRVVGVFRPEAPHRSVSDQDTWLAQARAAANPEIRLECAKAIVSAKVARQLTFVRRVEEGRERRLVAFDAAATGVARASSLDALRGHEGQASRIWFEALSEEFTKRPGDARVTATWPFAGRARRPPPDPVNALLSFGYTILYAHAATALWAAGLLPSLGLLHDQRAGHLALASDLTEEFRHEVGRAVVAMINRREIRSEHFLRSEVSGDIHCRLTDEGRRTVLTTFDMRMRDIRLPGRRDGRVVELMGRQAVRFRDYFLGTAARYEPFV